MAKRKLSFWCIVNKDTREPVVLGKQNTYQSEGRAWGVARSGARWLLSSWNDRVRVFPTEDEIETYVRGKYDVLELVLKNND